jgi:hypothetical protein
MTSSHTALALCCTVDSSILNLRTLVSNCFWSSKLLSQYFRNAPRTSMSFPTYAFIHCCPETNSPQNVSCTYFYLNTVFPSFCSSTFCHFTWSEKMVEHSKILRVRETQKKGGGGGEGGTTFT